MKFGNNSTALNQNQFKFDAVLLQPALNEPHIFPNHNAQVGFAFPMCVTWLRSFSDAGTIALQENQRFVLRQ